jgi:hypothetical protein
LICLTTRNASALPIVREQDQYGERRLTFAGCGLS